MAAWAPSDSAPAPALPSPGGLPGWLHVSAVLWYVANQTYQVDATESAVLVCASGAWGVADAGAAPAVLRQWGAVDASAAPGQGVCRARATSSLEQFALHLRHCVVLLGTLQPPLIENTPANFENISFPNLREVTEFVVVYRVMGLLSLGQLFPNLARIRGRRLINNYALVVHDVSTLTEIGLYGLTRIDRGGVEVWGVDRACFVHSVAWARMAPRARLELPARALAHCAPCSCDLDPARNHCWNNRKCQIYLEGDGADECHEQCLGCRKTRSNECSLCRHYTHRGRCVSECPSDTIILPDSQYCVSRAECAALAGWAWNGTCVFHCPLDYSERAEPGATTCVYDPDTDKTCDDLEVWAVGKAQEAEGCVFVNGSLEIHIRLVPDAMSELRTYLSRIREVSDYIYIFSSTTITSLDFLPSLERIRGRRLKNNRYSLVIHDMTNLQTLFSPNVTRHLIIDRGTLRLYNNPTLCRSEIDGVMPRFPVRPDDIDLPVGMNGYSGGCADQVHFQVRVINETAALIMFSTLSDPHTHYSVLYARLRREAAPAAPEACSAAAWRVARAHRGFGQPAAVVELTSLRPASTYAICVETYDPVRKTLARSNVSNFTTPVGKPAPSFLVELAASNSTAVLVRWLDHKDYLHSITHYELAVSSLIHERDIDRVDQCELFEHTETDSSLHPHAVTARPPPEYAGSCETACGVAAGAPEDHFDICGVIGCDDFEDTAPGDSSLGGSAGSGVLVLRGGSNNFTVGGLAPFRDYRFELRACAGAACSRAARGSVRTRATRAAAADRPRHVRARLAAPGLVAVAWEPPADTNGPVLSYSVQVECEPAGSGPQARCVPAGRGRASVRAGAGARCRVRVCARTLGARAACGAWLGVPGAARGAAPAWAALLAAGAALAAAAGTYCWRRRRAPCGAPDRAPDRAPILAASASLAREDPPCMFSDTAPMYDIPLRETRLL